ncbi:MAG: TAXI family TRAP transporter solute-binding subunit [Fuerstiella sp.]|jgi:TRAP-type uncharacterized transport system substrate-binding protein|nr:TAXI family TRAP transporter solute-binding subunit [Fuerstiella sp.]
MSRTNPDDAQPWRTTWKRSPPGYAIIIIVLTASIFFAYWWTTELPAVVRIAGGPANGRYAALANGLAQELRTRLAVEVVVTETAGSLENLNQLETNQVHFGLYQPETREILAEPNIFRGEEEPAAFVSNLYPEFLLPVAANDSSAALNRIDKRIWCCNDHLSGDFAMTQLLLRHISDDRTINVEHVPYADLPEQIADGNVDIGIICCGLRAPVVKELLTASRARLVDVPFVDALARRNSSLSRDVVPAGYFQIAPAIPPEDFHTVSLDAQLLAGNGTPVGLVEEVTRIVTDARFQRRHGLNRLIEGGATYATQRPEFELHAGASHIFYPDLKPFINPDFVEGTEGIRSFVVSLLAAVWLLHRWWTKRLIRSQEHRLDRYIRQLLELERQQMEVDGEGNTEESQRLQTMLDNVTVLRQEALSEFTSHELNEDRAVDCFLEMCHALSDKINAKLTRHSLNALRQGL